MSAIDLSGWIILSILAALLLVQGRTLRRFERPRLAKLESWPSLTIVLTASSPDSEIRRSIAEVSRLDYGGDIEILVVTDSKGEAASLEQLAIASSRLRIVEASQFTADIGIEASGAWILFLPPGIHVEKEAVERFISTVVDELLDVALLLPRLDIGWGFGTLTEPLLPWLHLTFFSAMNDAPFGGDAVMLLVRREHCRTDRPPSPMRTLDAFDTAWRGPIDSKSYVETLRSGSGSAPGRLLLLALALPTLFTLPVVFAIVTNSFPWIVSAVVSYWIRFRVAARTGEPIPLALFHPLAVLFTTLDLIAVVVSRSSRNQRDRKT